MKRSAVVAIGECMVELSRASDGRFSLAFGGDTFNTAVYVARLGIPIAYATRLGDDPYSAGIVALGQEEGVDTSLIVQVPGRNAGLYLIETAANGERSFHYWRDRAPARELFDTPQSAAAVVAAMQSARLVYFSGITLSLYADAALERFWQALAEARAAGATIAFDGNFRPRGWDGGSPAGFERARATYRRFLSLVDIALPSIDDEAKLWGDGSAEDCFERLQRLGVRDIVLKCAEHGAIVSTGNGHRYEQTHVPVPAVVAAVDTTAAGDSFNAAYLASHLKGRAAPDAAALGHRLAAVVVSHRGAIVPPSVTAAVSSG